VLRGSGQSLIIYCSQKCGRQKCRQRRSYGRLCISGQVYLGPFTFTFTSGKLCGPRGMPARSRTLLRNTRRAQSWVCQVGATHDTRALDARRHTLVDPEQDGMVQPAAATTAAKAAMGGAHFTLMIATRWHWHVVCVELQQPRLSDARSAARRDPHPRAAWCLWRAELRAWHCIVSARLRRQPMPTPAAQASAKLRRAMVWG
jgi:hypothetical protein